MAKDIVDVAISQIGYSENGNNNTKYGKWYGMNYAPWCQMFVSWCAYKAGLSTSIIPKTASTSTGMAWFKNRGRFKYKGSYTPKRGDIIYFKSAGASHVGIVEYSSGSYVHTIEGNTSNRVARRSYLKTNARITGYGIPNYPKTSSSKKSSSSSRSSSKKTSSTKQASSEELAYLRKIVNQKQTKTTNITGTIEDLSVSSGNVVVMVKNSSSFFEIPIKDDLEISWERTGTPGKLTFSTPFNSTYKIVEGNSVTVSVNGTNFFYGFVFQRSFSKDGFVSITVYDQLRYLKNKDTMIYKNKRATDVIKTIATKFNLKCGTLDNTSLKISKVENNVTLFDIIQNALDATLDKYNKMYVLYDNAGKLMLKNISSMKVNACVIDNETAEDFDYQTSIDKDVYNQIKLVYENKDKGKYEYYMAKSTKSINNYGVLQYCEKLETPDIGKLKAQALLKLYNKRAKSLSISGVFGNKNVRAGSLVPVILNVKDCKISNYMLVEKVTHKFSNKQWTMDLVLVGGGFDV